MPKIAYIIKKLISQKWDSHSVGEDTAVAYWTAEVLWCHANRTSWKYALWRLLENNSGTWYWVKLFIAELCWALFTVEEAMVERLWGNQLPAECCRLPCTVQAEHWESHSFTKPSGDRRWQKKLLPVRYFCLPCSGRIRH